MNFLYGLLASGLVGSLIFVVLLAIRPVTVKLFSKTWHYYSLLVPILFLLGGTVIAAGVINHVRDVDYALERGGVDVDIPMDLVMPPLPRGMDMPTDFVTPPLPIAIPQLTESAIVTAQPHSINDPSADIGQAPAPSQFTLAFTGFSYGFADFARVGYRVMLAIWGLGVLLFIGISRQGMQAFESRC